MIKIRKLTLCLLLTLVLFTVGAVIAGDAFALWYNPNWDYRQMITIDSSQVPGDLTNFPVLISTTDPNLRVSPGGNVGKANGGDILFTSADGITKLDHEIESYNSTTGELIAWVEVPNVSSTADTVVYMYYGNAGAANQWNINGTWDEGGSNNFLMIQHLKEISGTHFDSTSNGNNGTPQNGVIQNATGQIDGADDFAGDDDYVDVLIDVSETNYAVELWFKSTCSNCGVFSVDDGILGSNGHDRHIYLSSGNICTRVWSNETICTSGTSYANGEWHHVVHIFGGSVGGQKIFVDGTQRASGSKSSSNFNWQTGINIGFSNDAVNDYLNGLIDEVRISNIARSPDWIETSYNNQSAPSSFLNFGAPAMFTPVPSMTEWGMIIFMVLAGLLSIYYLRRKRIES